MKRKREDEMNDVGAPTLYTSSHTTELDEN